MKNTTRELLRDLKVAALLGKPEAVSIALNGLLEFPGVAANDRMDDGFIEKTILPVGFLLSMLRINHLRPLLGHNLAAGRAIGAVAFSDLYITGRDATIIDLSKPANDPRLDVRLSLGKALFSNGDKDRQKLLDLGAQWLEIDAPRSRYTALIFLPSLAESHGGHLIDLFAPVGHDTDRDVRGALVDALNLLARSGWMESVLKLLGFWSAEEYPNAWVISRVLSASWVVSYPDEAEIILRDLSSKTGTSSQVKSAVEALARHGVQINI